MAQLTLADLIAAQKAVSQGGPWRKDSQAKDWVGKPIAEALRLDLDSKADRAKIKGALKIWTGNRMFKEVERPDDTHHKRCFIEVGTLASDGETRVTWSSRMAAAKAKAKGRTAEVSAFISLGQKQQLRERGFSEQDIFKMTPVEAHRILGLNDRFQKVEKAPDGVECVYCQRTDERQVFKIRDTMVPPGQPGGRPECLHEDCAANWFTGRFGGEPDTLQGDGKR
jgi:hypothetical protein